jgi:hypothetical protein
MLEQTQHNYPEAYRHFTAGLERIPLGHLLEWKLLERKANTERLLGDTIAASKSLGELQALIDRGGGGPMARFQLAEVDSRSGNHAAALKIVRELIAECRIDSIYDAEPWLCEMYHVGVVEFEMRAGLYSPDQEARLNLAIERFGRIPGGPYDETIASVHLLLARYLMNRSRWQDAARSFDRASEIRQVRRSRGLGFWPEDEWLEIQRLLERVPTRP